MKLAKNLLVLLFILSSVYSFSQNEPKITEQIRQNSSGSFNALVMELPGKVSAVNSIKKEWGAFAKQFKGKTSFNKKADEYFTDDARIKEMSENTVDITAKIISKDAETIELIVWFNLGVTYLSSKEYSQGMGSAQTILKDFSKIVYVDLFKENLADEEKVLKEMNKELSSTKKEADSYEKKINSYREEIKKIEKKIAEVKEQEASNKEKQAKQKTEIDGQEKKIDAIKKEIEVLKRRK